MGIVSTDEETRKKLIREIADAAGIPYELAEETFNTISKILAEEIRKSKRNIALPDILNLKFAKKAMPGTIKRNIGKALSSFVRVADRHSTERLYLGNNIFVQAKVLCRIPPGRIGPKKPRPTAPAPNPSPNIEPSKKTTMNKAELVNAIASESKLSKVTAEKALDAFVNQTTKALKGGNRVALVGFGSFSVAKRAARNGRNPQTGKAIKIAAKKVAKFKAGANLAEKVNK